MKNIVQAINEVMKAAKGVGKNSLVGSGSYAYKGVQDMDVKQLLQPLLTANELVIIPSVYEEDTEVKSWEVNGKLKSQTFVKLKATYLLIHSSGEQLTLQGIGHGIDSADKAAGKAATYALKNCLLYTFLVPAGLDDTDSTHSDELPQKPVSFTAPSKWLNRFEQTKNGSGEWVNTKTITEEWKAELTAVRGGSKSLEQVLQEYKMKKEVKDEFVKLATITK